MTRIKYPYKASTVFSDPNPPFLPTEVNGRTDETIEELTIVDYRYARFALDSRTGLFSLVRYVLPFYSHLLR